MEVLKIIFDIGVINQGFDITNINLYILFLEKLNIFFKYLLYSALIAKLVFQEN